MYSFHGSVDKTYPSTINIQNGTLSWSPVTQIRLYSSHKLLNLSTHSLTMSYIRKYRFFLNVLLQQKNLHCAFECTAFFSSDSTFMHTPLAQSHIQVYTTDTSNCTKLLTMACMRRKGGGDILNVVLSSSNCNLYNWLRILWPVKSVRCRNATLHTRHCGPTLQ